MKNGGGNGGEQAFFTFIQEFFGSADSLLAFLVGLLEAILAFISGLPAWITDGAD